MKILESIANNPMDAVLSSTSAAAAQYGYNSVHHPQQDPNDMLGQIVVPILVGVIVPFLKDVLNDWRQRRKERKRMRRH